MRVLVRTAVIAAVFALFFLAVEILPDAGGDANIGVGLLAFAVVFLAAGAWGIADGLRSPIVVTAATWAIVGLVIGVLVPVFSAVAESGLSWDTLTWKMAVPEVFLTVLVAVPALLGAGLGALLRSVRPAT